MRKIDFNKETVYNILTGKSRQMKALNLRLHKNEY